MASEMCCREVVPRDISRKGDRLMRGGGGVCGIAAISGSWADTFILVTVDIK